MASNCLVCCERLIPSGGLEDNHDVKPGPSSSSSSSHRCVETFKLYCAKLGVDVNAWTPSDLCPSCWDQAEKYFTLESKVNVIQLEQSCNLEESKKKMVKGNRYRSLVIIDEDQPQPRRISSQRLEQITGLKKHEDTYSSSAMSLWDDLSDYPDPSHVPLLPQVEPIAIGFNSSHQLSLISRYAIEDSQESMDMFSDIQTGSGSVFLALPEPPPPQPPQEEEEEESRSEEDSDDDSPDDDRVVRWVNKQTPQWTEISDTSFQFGPFQATKTKTTDESGSDSYIWRCGAAECGFEFDDANLRKPKEKMRRHILLQHMDERTQCKFCDKVHESPAELKTHEYSCRLLKPKKTAKRTCKKCKRVFPDQSKLKLHKCKKEPTKSSSDKPSSRFKCSICHEFRSSKAALARHMESYHATKSLEERQTEVCQYCGKKFTGDALIRHLRLNHQVGTPLVMHECRVPGCPSSFPYKSKLKRHYFKKHKLAHSPPPMKNEREEDEDSDE